MATLQETITELERQKANSYDLVVPTQSIVATVNAEQNTINLDFPMADGSFKSHGITQYCHGQIADKTGIPKRYYDRMLSEQKLDLLTRNINTWMPDKDKRLIRVLDNQARALLSDRYRILNNLDVLYASMEEFTKVQDQFRISIEIQRTDLSETYLYLKAVSTNLYGLVTYYKERSPAKVYGGIVISNSEVGAGAFSVKPYMVLESSGNSIICEQSFRQVHLGRELDVGFIDWSAETRSLEDKTIWSKIRDRILGTFNPKVFQAWLDEISQVAYIEVPLPTVAVDNVIRQFELPKTMKDTLINQFAKETPTQWGLAMAVSSLAQQEKNYDDQIKLEEISSKILTPNATKTIIKGEKPISP
jgi:hypothetical protein